MTKYSKLILVPILLLVSFSVYSQSISLSFPSGVSVCDQDVILQIVASNNSGDTMVNGEIEIDFGDFIGAQYDEFVSQVSGPVVSEVNAGVPIFTFVDTLFDGESIDFEIRITTNCMSLPVGGQELTGVFDFRF